MKNVSKVDLSLNLKEKGKISLRGKDIDSARRREDKLIYNTSKRDEEAIQLAHEALELSKQLDRIESRERITPTRSKSKIKKSSSTNIKSKKSSPYLRQRSKSVPPKKRKSSITVDPYRAPPSGSRDRDG